MEQLKKTDILITTALIAGKKAPLLVTKKMLGNMPCGSVVIDMASENGGNVEGSQDNLVIDYKGIKILGNSNLAAKVPYSSSTLFANNLYNFIASQYSTEKQNIIFNFDFKIAKTTHTVFSTFLPYFIQRFLPYRSIWQLYNTNSF